MTKHKRKAELNIDPRELRDLLIGASYYLGGKLERERTIGQAKEVNRIRGTFDELVDEIDGQIERGEV